MLLDCSLHGPQESLGIKHKAPTRTGATFHIEQGGDICPICAENLAQYLLESRSMKLQDDAPDTSVSPALTQ